MSIAVRVRLSLAMFLQYFMFGSWLVTLGTYMSKGLAFDDIIGNAYGLQGIAAVISTLVVGAVADRYFAAQKVMGILSILAGTALLVLTTIDASKPLFLLTLLAHFLFFVPTIPLASSIALGAMSEPSSQFPAVRVLGTVGWIVAGLLVGVMPGAAQTQLPLLIGGFAGLVLGIYAFSLPDTPPRARNEPVSWGALLGLDLVRRVRDRDFWVFIACTLVAVIPLSFYNAYCNNFLVEANARVNFVGITFEPAAIQTLGQGSEFVFLLLLPLLLVRVGIKAVLLCGMLAWAARYALFALGFDGSASNTGMLITGVLLHGICYDFFFVASQLYIEQRFDASARSRAQAFLVMINMGLGVMLGSNFANMVYRANTLSAIEHQWAQIWIVPAGISLAVAAAFALLFRGPRAVLSTTTS
jgi:nucleoside transporter